MRAKLLPAVLAAFTLLLVALVPAAHAGGTPREVLYVGNNWEGTADVIDPRTFKRIGRLNIVPDKEERLAQIQADPVAYGFFLGIREQVGEGNDQFVDDMFSSPDGRFLYVSRPSFADVVGIEIATGRIVWRVEVDGYRADHMAISPDGSRLLVSASTAKVVHVIDPRVGRIVGNFPSGDQPHENNYSKDGSLIFHASIGTVFSPLDDPALDATKGQRYFQIVDARTLQIIKRLDMGQKLEEAGYPNMSASVRPMTLSPDERWLYFQVSFHHGFVEYDLQADRVTRVAYLPISEEAARKRREEYLLDSAHHGLTMNPEGTKLCAAGTMSDYAGIVRRDTFATTIASTGSKPYWSTNSGDGRYCFISYSGDDVVSVVDYATEREVARVPVGNHPQRMRMGTLAAGALERPRLVVRATPQRVRARRRPTVMTVTVGRRENGRVVPVAGARIGVAGVVARTDASGRAVLRKRLGFGRAGRHVVSATRAGHTPGRATITVLRAAGSLSGSSLTG